jgi:glycosyltransferase involved in cell wall biosynthesis
MQLAERIASGGTHVHCLTYATSEDQGGSYGDVLDFQTVPYFLRRLRGSVAVAPRPRTLRQIGSQMLPLPGEVWHLHHPSSLSIAAAIALSRKRETPLVFTSHDPMIASGLRAIATRTSLARFLRQGLSGTLEWGIRSIPYATADRVVALTNYERHLLVAQGLNPRHVVTIPNGVEPVPRTYGLKERLGIGGIPMVLTVARFVKQKGLAYLLDAVPSIISKTPAHFVFIGREGEEASRLYDMSARFRSNVTILIGASDSDLMQAFTECDLFVLPSLYESFGVACVEAMSAGKPVITTRVGGLPEVVAHQRDGLLVAPRDSAALARAIKEVLANPSLKEKMGTCAAEDARAKFNWAKVAAAYKALYAEVDRA